MVRGSGPDSGAEDKSKRMYDGKLDSWPSAKIKLKSLLFRSGLWDVTQNGPSVYSDTRAHANAEPPASRVHVRGGGRCSEQFKTLLNRKKTHSFLNKSCVTYDSESIEHPSENHEKFGRYGTSSAVGLSHHVQYHVVELERHVFVAIYS